jgi:hypothetical protein
MKADARVTEGATVYVIQVISAELDNIGIQLNKIYEFHATMTHNFPQGASVSSTQDEYAAGVGVCEHGRMYKALVIALFPTL